MWLAKAIRALVAAPYNPLMPGGTPQTDRFIAEAQRRRCERVDRSTRLGVSVDLASLGLARWYWRGVLADSGLRPKMNVLWAGNGPALLREQVERIVGSNSLVHANGTAYLDTFDFAVHAYGSTLREGLGEVVQRLYGALRAEGRICIFAVTRPRYAMQRTAMRDYLSHVVPAMARLADVPRDGVNAHDWRRWADILDQCDPPDAIVDLLKSQHFGEIRFRTYLDCFSHFAGTRPVSAVVKRMPEL
jgi:hypothetical protein